MGSQPEEVRAADIAPGNNSSNSGRADDMTNCWVGVTIDCVDVERVAEFWSALLGRPKAPDRTGWVYLGHPGDPKPRLNFQPVNEPKHGKVRLHLDIAVDDIDQGIDHSIAQVVALGGRFTDQRHDDDEGVVFVLADPEEHEFCLLQYY
jgi:predicted enzyme related to lactoylglutathione lyase